MVVLPPTTFRPYQIPVLTSKALDDVTVSAPQLGKSAVGAWWLFGCAAEHGRDLRPWWWTSPTYSQAKHGIGLLAHFARSAGLLLSATATFPLRVELTNGAVIEGRSWDRPEGMYGPSVLGIVVDEFGQLTPQAYSAISSRRAETIRQGFGYARYLGNVGPMDGTAHGLWEQAERGDAGFECRRWTWRDRAEAHDCGCGLPVDLEHAQEHRPACERGVYVRFIAREAARMGRVQFRSLWEAEWADWNELPVYEFDRAIHVRPDLSLQRALEVDLSCDFNVDPMAWIIGQHHGGEAWAVDEISLEGGSTTVDACNEFIRRYPDAKLHIAVYGDASGTARKTSATQTDYQIIQSILGSYYQQLRICVPKSNPPVMDRVNAYNAMLKPADGSTPRYYISDKCVGLATDLARVSFKPGSRELDKRNKKLTHYTDADGYRVVSVAPVSGPSVVAVGYGYEGHGMDDSMLRVEW